MFGHWLADGLADFLEHLDEPGLGRIDQPADSPISADAGQTAS